MTGLMVVFLFVAIAYISKVNNSIASLEDTNKDKKEIISQLNDLKKKNEILESKVFKHKEVVEEYVGLRKQVFEDLKKIKQRLGKRWKVEIDKDLSVKLTDSRALFKPNTAVMKSEFTAFLDSFFPLFIKLITSEKYKGKLAEVRIEGHTGYINGYSAWVGNTTLSQRRSNSVLKYMLKNSAYKKLSLAQKDYLNFILTSNGLAYGKAFDKNGGYLYETQRGKGKPYYTSKEIDNVRSLRVEFRIVTSSEELVKKLLEQQKK
jgi:outer membrane protein OmpA-like peptidoglycan-associated protein